MTTPRRADGRPYRSKPYDPLHHSRRARAAIRAMFAVRGDTCHLCGHRGAREADLLTPRAVAPHQPIHPGAYRPAHGTSCRCPICGRACNQERGARPVQDAKTEWTPRISW
jgi:hypothetical protein